MQSIQNRTACLDMEGVLIPELWPHLAHTTGISEFKITTRDMPDYVSLVEQRIRLLRKHDITLKKLQQLISDVDFLEGAVDFFEEIRRYMNVIVVSDAFAEMIIPFHEKLGSPAMHCNHFHCDEEGYVCAAQYIRQHGKHETVETLQSYGHWVLAVGDAYNDLGMLRKADIGFLYKPSRKVREIASDIYIAENHLQILQASRMLLG